RELMVMKKQGYRAVVLFAGLHNGFDCFKIAEYIDPEYDKLLKQALKEGVEAYAYAGEFEKINGIPTALSLTKVVPFINSKPYRSAEKAEL
ncbi:MAG: DNA/RNA nuclease SfsA, partial [Actinobacillus porcinus]